jgi:hypothetical protein
VEPDARYFRRRASEELAAANRAVTEAARQRRMTMAAIFLERLKALEPAPEIVPPARRRTRAASGQAGRPAFEWTAESSLEQA